ncbi:LIM domain only protein 3 [Polyplax serrata]
MNKLMRPNYDRSANVNPMQDKNTSKLVEVCQGCRKPIRDKYLLNTLGRSWHEDCLKCTCCEARLGEVGASLYTRANLILCKRDYLRLFGNTGHCSACQKVIPAFEMVMRAKGNVYHLECFACQFCGYRFCVGDRFYLSDNKVLCEADYNEKIAYENGPINCYENSMMVSGRAKEEGKYSGGRGCDFETRDLSGV